MAKKVLEGLSVQAPVPLDDRTVCDLINDLNLIKLRAYDGLETYCRENETVYVYNGTYKQWDIKKTDGGIY